MMMEKNSMELDKVLNQLPLIAILRGVTPDAVLGVTEALYQAQLLCVEVPMNSPHPLESIAQLADMYGNKMLVGAGTVVTVSDIEKIAKAGGRLIVMPHSDALIIQAAKQAGLYCIPGFATPTEAYAALQAGADALKYFPADHFPPPILKAVRSILPSEVPILPTGGITPEKIPDYVAVGANGFGLGSALYRPGDTPETVAAQAAKFVTTMQACKG